MLPDSERIVVTGMGCVSPLGGDLDSTWEGVRSGRSGIGPIDSFDTEGLPVDFAGQVTAELDLGDVPHKEARRLDKVVRFTVAATREALAGAKLEVGEHNAHRIGVAIGSGVGGLETISNNLKALLNGGVRRVSPFTIPMAISNMCGGFISIHHGLRGPNLCHVSACASGAHSIGEALHVIRRGEADVMIAGGAEAPIVDIGVAGFAAMRALSTRRDEPERASRPFDQGRDGFVMAEGAGALVLESLAHARARGATIHAEVLGYGASGDGLHMAAPDETGDGAARCILLALEHAELAPEAVGHVNAHATSTEAGDVAEAVALRRVFGKALDEIPVSATKSSTGHALGAAGALEAILTIRSLEDECLPPTINLDDPDPACALDHVALEARRASPRIALSNSFGFGGTNAALLFARPD